MVAPDVPISPAHDEVFVAPPRGTLLRRGLLRHCPVCGSGHLFTGYFRIKERCPRCGLRFQRHEGQWSGDIGLNTVVTFSLLYVVMLGGVLVMWGHLDVALLTALCAAIVFVFPVVFMPFAKTLWIAIDLAVRPLEPDELERAPADPDPTSRSVPPWPT